MSTDVSRSHLWGHVNLALVCEGSSSAPLNSRFRPVSDQKYACDGSRKRASTT
jgi:hypothetical protein